MMDPGIRPSRVRDLTQAVHDNLRNLGLDVLEVVNLRAMFDIHHPGEGSLEAPLSVLADLQRQGLIRHIGLSNVTPTQFTQGSRIAPIVCVQNYYNLAHRADDPLIDDLAQRGIAYVPFFPLGGFTPLQSTTLSDVASRLGATPMQVALAWLLQRSANILLIPGTSSLAHLRENLATESLTLPADALERAVRSVASPVGGPTSSQRPTIWPSPTGQHHRQPTVPGRLEISAERCQSGTWHRDRRTVRAADRSALSRG